MGRIVKGNKLKVGDIVKVIDATRGAYGANDRVGVVVDRGNINEEKISGLQPFKGDLIIKLNNPAGFKRNIYWRVGFSGEYEILTSNRKQHFDIDVVVKGYETKVVIGDKVGTSRCKEEDDFNEAYGIILAVAGAYKLSKEKREALVDALYDGVKTLEDYDSLEIINELKSRVED